MPDRNHAETAASSGDPYATLLEKRKQLAYLADVEDLLNWDEYTVMPDEGGPARTNQQGALSTLQQQHRSDTEIGELLAAIEPAELTDDERAVVREIRREYERDVAVPMELSRELSETTSEAVRAWQQAKAENDFDRFESHLEDVVELKREEAAAIDADADPYEVLFTDYAPYLELETVDQIFDRLKGELIPLLESIRESNVELSTDAFEGTVAVDTQVDACRAILDELGFDWDRGSFAAIPPAGMTLGNQFDCRVGVNPKVDDLRITVFGTLHEFGHAVYNQNLPRDRYGSPLGTDRGTTAQESQAVFWECHIGRSPEFWRYIQPTIVDHVPSVEAGSTQLYESVTQVRPDDANALRADELTWQLHMLVRYEIERGLIRGDIDPVEVPAIWRDKYEEYLGIRPESDAEGPLLTVHWATGYYGYFPTYTLGHVLAAQFAATARESIDDFDQRIQRGEFDTLQTWLAEEIHQHGQRFTTPELVRRVTGTELTADPFIDYVREKYGELYEL